MANYIGFKTGFEQIPNSLVRVAKMEIMETLGIRSRSMFLKYLKGESIVRADKITAIEDIFLKYHISSIWDQ